MKSRKEEILRVNQLPSSSPTGNTTSSTSSSVDRFTPSTPFSTDNSTPSTSFFTRRSSDTYVYGVGVLAVLAISFSYLLHITLLRLQIKNKPIKNRINHQNGVICFRSDDEKTLYNK